MTKQDKPSEHILQSLQERAKELNCLYQVEEILSRPEDSIDDVGRQIVEILPKGYQHSDVCRARLTLLGKLYERDDFVESEWRQAADISVQDDLIGEVEVFYGVERPKRGSVFSSCREGSARRTRVGRTSSRKSRIRRTTIGRSFWISYGGPTGSC